MYYTTKDFTSNILIVKEEDVDIYYKKNYNIKDIMEKINNLTIKINDIRKKLNYKMFFEYEDTSIYEEYYSTSKLLYLYLNSDNGKNTNEIFRIYNQFRFNFADRNNKIERKNYESSYYHDCRPAQTIGNTNCNVQIVGGYNNMGARSPGFFESIISGPNLVGRA